MSSIVNPFTGTGKVIVISNGPFTGSAPSVVMAGASASVAAWTLRNVERPIARLFDAHVPAAADPILSGFP